MAKNILVATPQPAFGEFLRLSLEESGRYRVRLVPTGREVLSSLEQTLFSLVILDAALTDPPFSYVVQGLRARQADLRLLVIPPEAGSDLPEIRAAQPDGCISQPFYTPSLLETIDRLTAAASTPIPPVSQPTAAAQTHSVLPTAEQAGLVLEEFLNDTTAPAVLVLEAGQPWVWAGQLERSALDEVAQLLTRYITSNEGVDMARYVHLQTDGGEYLIYATPLPERLILVMVYQVATPLTVIRVQAGRLARLLRQPAASQSAPQFVPPTPQPALVPPVAQKAPVVLTKAPRPPAPPIAEDEDEGDDDARLQADAQRLVDLLAEMPDPNPVETKTSAPSFENTQPATEDDFMFPWEHQQAPDAASQAPTIPIRLTRSAEVSSDLLATALDARLPLFEETFTPQVLAETDLNAEGELIDSPIMSGSSIQPGISLPDWLTPAPTSNGEDSPPMVLHTLQSIQQAKPIASSFSHLAYTCLLIPRLPNHNLIGPLADRLRDWLPQLCLAYGWRLENLFVRPEYLQWTVQVAPTISPGNVVRLIRQQSSRRIFLQFPHYEIENPSGDFWAPGFLIISGFQPPSIHLVQDFIRQTRTRQSSWMH